jgi:hypothetical protein
MVSIELLAELYYESFRIYRQNQGDYSRNKWCDATDDDRKAAVATVKKGLLDGLGSIYEIGDTSIMPEDVQVSAGIAIGLCNGLKPLITEATNV